MKQLTLISVAILSLALSGCAVTSAAIEGGDRSTARSLDDMSASRAINTRMKRAYEYKLSGVEVEVAEGIAVLSGTVPDPDARIEAERIAWSAPGVYKVGNEIRIGEKIGLIGNTKDNVLKQSIRTRLIADKNVSSLNYNIEVNDGTVYLLGLAESPEELERAAHIASTTRGTAEVVSYVRLAGQPLPGGSFAAQQPALPPMSAPTPLPAPQPNYRPLPNNLSTTPDSLPSTEPYFRDPNTGEKVILPPGTKTVPYRPDVNGGNFRPYYIDPENGEKVMVVYTTEVD